MNHCPLDCAVIKYDTGRVLESTDELAIEEPLEIRVRGRAVSVTMRTPGHDDELAAGFLLAEGLTTRRADLLRIEHCTRNEAGNVLNILLSPDVPFDLDRLTRHVFASSSCGLCGKATIDSIGKTFPPIQSNLRIDPAVLLKLPDAMREAQRTFDRTGGLHAAALFDATGRLVVLREDVGRHNAVDKVLGHALLNDQLPLSDHVLLVSGRTSFEILQKSLAAGVGLIASISAPSSLAVEFAQENRQTLVGFLRGTRMNVYTHPHRIAGLSADVPGVLAT